MSELKAPPGERVEPSAINDLGQVVGVILDEGNYYEKAFVWDQVDGFRILNDMVDEKLECSIREATDINDLGQITAWAVCLGTEWDDFTIGIVLTPIR